MRKDVVIELFSTYDSSYFIYSEHVILLASRTEWLNLTALEGFADEELEVLAERDLSRRCLDYLRDDLQNRISVVSCLCDSESR